MDIFSLVLRILILFWSTGYGATGDQLMVQCRCDECKERSKGAGLEGIRQATMILEVFLVHCMNREIREKAPEADDDLCDKIEYEDKINPLCWQCVEVKHDNMRVSTYNDTVYAGQRILHFTCTTRYISMSDRHIRYPDRCVHVHTNHTKIVQIRFSDYGTHAIL